jgi:hypothetical protein
VVGVTYLHQQELIDFVIGEAMEVLQEEFQFLIRERFVVSVVSHAHTLRLTWVTGPLRPEATWAGVRPWAGVLLTWADGPQTFARVRRCSSALSRS